MKNKQFGKTLTGTTGKDLLSLMGKKEIFSSKSVVAVPSTPAEIIIATFWKSLLAHDSFDVNDDFFKVGGNSLKAIQLLSRISSQFHIPLTLTDIFLYPTIAQIAKMLGDRKNQKQVLPPLISVKERPQYVPLSFNQERLWFIDQLEGSIQYHIPAVFRLKGILNKEALAVAFERIVLRHEILRSVVHEEDGNCYQLVQKPGLWQLSFTDGSLFKNDRNQIQSYLRQLINKPFDLSKDHMLRVELIGIGEHEHILLVVLHHIASDGWSTSIIIEELVQLYRAFDENVVPSLQPLPVQYADYAIWQRSYLQGDVLRQKLDYWKRTLEGITPLQLPADFPKSSFQSFNASTEKFSIDKETFLRLKLFSGSKGATLFMTLLSVFKVLFHRYSGQTDISIGTAVAGRQQQELEGMIGFFVNTLVLRSRIDNKLSFTDFLAQVKATTLEAFQHQEVPFEKVVEAVVKERDMSRPPLFQVAFILQNTPDAEAIHVGEVELSEESFDRDKAKFELDFSITETADGLQGTVEYCTDLFRRDTIVRMLAHFKTLLHSAITFPERSISVLRMLSTDEEQQLLFQFNDTFVSYPHKKSVISLFEEQVEKTADAVAVIFDNKKITYQELNQSANRVAHYLLSKGIKEEMLVPICVERSQVMIVGILGILKCGAAFVPIDPEYPIERINYMLTDIAANIVICTTESRAKLQNLEHLDFIEIDKDWPVILDQPTSGTRVIVSGNHLAYVIHTSGSTGMPKGVMIEHHSVVNLLKSIVQTVGFEAEGGFLSVTTYSFDICYLEFFVPLISGGQLIIVAREVAIDGFRLAQSIADYGPTHMQATPATWQLLLEAGWQNIEGIKILIGGEAIKEEIKNALTSIGEVFNLYGPTETTIWSVSKKLSFNEKVLIGKPLANTGVYILGDQMQLVPVGVPAEIYITGDGLARGYLNRPDLTEQRFINDPFSDIPGSKMYRTGDIGRWLPDGNIECFGRIDDQVKIRGYRIELGEIETVLQQSGLVKQQVVVVKEDSLGNKRLVGYIVPGDSFDKDTVTSFLKTRLPEYMIPVSWIKLSALPLTPNGKIDRKALPEPGKSELVSNKYTPPRSELEVELADIWQKQLGIDQIGIYDNFFEHGGHSLMATRIVSAVRKKLNVEIAIKDIFSFPTIAALAASCETTKHGLQQTISSGVRPYRIPLSYSQERLLFIDNLEGTIHYHLPAVFRLKGNLNKGALAYALQQVINRHEVLRTVLTYSDDQPFQTINDKDNWHLSEVDGASFNEGDDQLQQLIQQIVKKPFDLSADHMLRATLIALQHQEHLLVITMHHIASDGWSENILTSEVAAFYNDYLNESTSRLLPLAIQYADYSIWQRRYLQGEVLKQKLQYWENKLEGLTQLQLFTDYSRPLVQSMRGASEHFSIPRSLSGHLQDICREEGATLFMTLLSAFNVLLYRYTRQEDICVGTPIANRTSHEVEQLIGFFVNTLAIRNEINGDQSFIELLRQVKKTTLDAYDNQDVPFEKVVEAVVKERDMSRSPLFQVMFVLQNTPSIAEPSFGEVQLSAEKFSNTTAKFDLTFYITETEQGLQGAVEYSTDLYDTVTIDRMIGHYVNLLESIVSDRYQRVGLLGMLGDGEEQHLREGRSSNALETAAEKTIVDMLEEQVERWPDNIAVVYGKEQLSYRELNDRANQLAHQLISKGVTVDTLVPLCLDRSLEMIIAIVGILKAGGAYVPMDPEYPSERIGFMIEDTGARLVVAGKSTRSLVAGLRQIEIIVVDEPGEQSKENPCV
ncbi:MAG: amino acid adenylation domain-containing protein, partial [Ferruginibacter sp.]